MNFKKTFAFRIERRDALTLIGAVGLCIVLAAVLAGLGGERRESLTRRPSTYFTDETGLRAAYLVLQRFTETRRWRRFLGLLPEPASDQAFDTLIVAEPPRPLSPGEATALKSWLAAGGQAILCLERDWAVGQASLSFGRAREGRDDDAAEASKDLDREARGGDKRQGLLESLGVELVEGEGGEGEADEPGEAPLELEDTSLSLRGEGLEPIVEADRGVRAATLAVGQGRLVVITDALAFANERLGESLNAVWLVRTASRWGLGRVRFDEYHHGFGQRRRLVSLMADFFATPWGWMCLQAALAGLAYLLVYRRRFGRLEPPEESRRIDPMEVVESRAGLLREAEARRLSLSWIHRALIFRLSRSLGYPVDLDDPETGRRLSRGEGARARGIREYLNRYRRLRESAAVGDADLQAAAQAAGRVAQELKTS